MRSHSIKKAMQMSDMQFPSVRGVDFVLGLPLSRLSCGFLSPTVVSQNINKTSPAPKSVSMIQMASQLWLWEVGRIARTPWSQFEGFQRDFKGTVYTNKHADVCIKSRAASHTPFSSEPWSPPACFRLTGFSFKSPDSDNFPHNPFRGAPRLTL